jgi:hypothetical protein
LGLTFDFIRIPVPVPRFVAIPTTQEITLPMAIAPQAVGAGPVAAMPQTVMYQAAVPQAPMAAVLPQAAYYQAAAPQAIMQQASVPQAMMQPAVPAAVPEPPTHALVPYQAHAIVPYQGQAVVPVQGQAMVPLQGQTAAQPQTFIANPAAIPQAPQPNAFTFVPQPTAQPLRMEDVDEFCRRVQALKNSIEAQRARGGN